MTAGSRCATTTLNDRARGRLAAPRRLGHRAHRADATRSDAELTFRVTDTSLDPYMRAFQPSSRRSRPRSRAARVRVVGELADPRAPARGRDRRRARSCGCSTTACATTARSASRSTSRSSRIARAAARRRGHASSTSAARVDLARPAGSRCARPATRTSASCRGSAATSAAPGRPNSRPTIDGHRWTSRSSRAGDDCRRPHPPLLVAARARGHQRPDRASTPRGLRLDGAHRAARRRPGPLRRPHRRSTATGRASSTSPRPARTCACAIPRACARSSTPTSSLRGPVDAPVLGGTVTVRKLASGPGGSKPRSTCSSSSARATPVAVAGRRRPRSRCASTCASSRRRTLRHRQQRRAHRRRAPTSHLRGTYDRPLLFGRAEIERGEVTFEGKRYVVTRGTIDFSNPNRIEPFFDVEARDARARPGPDLRVTLSVAGHVRAAAVGPQLGSAAADGGRPVAAVQRRGADRSGARRARAARRGASSSCCRRAPRSCSVEPALLRGRPRGRADLRRRHVPDHAVAGRPDRAVVAARCPGARLTIGKRISDRVYLTFSQRLGLVDDARSGHPARVRPERPVVVGAVAERGPHLRARCPREARVLMRVAPRGRGGRPADRGSRGTGPVGTADRAARPSRSRDGRSTDPGVLGADRDTRRPAAGAVAMFARASRTSSASAGSTMSWCRETRRPAASRSITS